MEEITGEEFVRRLHNESIDEYNELIVEIKQSIAIDLNKVIDRISFKNILFKGNSIRFYNSDLTKVKTHIIKFMDCVFESDTAFQNCSIYSLKFYSPKIHCASFIIKYCTIYETVLRHATFGKTFFSIKESSIESLDFEKLNLHDSKLNIEESHFPDLFSITLSTFKTLKINHCKFLKNFDFIKNKSISTPGSECFYNNEFNNVSFFETSFNNSAEFFYSTFSGICNFTGISNSPSSTVKFLDCSFEKYVQFDKANLSAITFENIKFNDIVSFQESKLETLFIDKTLFEKNALFDDIQIKDINNCSRRTIRNIKQQLQKSENKIDYNRFRSYELAAYYQELNWNGNFKDKFILWATKHVAGFDHSWRKALRFTLAACLIFYSLFFISENYSYPFDLRYSREFLSGAFRFLLVTDFYNPLSNGREYIPATNTIGWFLFILGKIVIAFGIYEMIQAFRKFKA